MLVLIFNTGGSILDARYLSKSGKIGWRWPPREIDVSWVSWEHVLLLGFRLLRSGGKDEHGMEARGGFDSCVFGYQLCYELGSRSISAMFV